MGSGTGSLRPLPQHFQHTSPQPFTLHLRVWEWTQPLPDKVTLCIVPPDSAARRWGLSLRVHVHAGAECEQGRPSLGWKSHKHPRICRADRTASASSLPACPAASGGNEEPGLSPSPTPPRPAPLSGRDPGRRGHGPGAARGRVSVNPPPSSRPIPTHWVVPVHQPQASSIVVLAQRQKYRSMEQNRKPGDKSTHIWTPYL